MKMRLLAAAAAVLIPVSSFALSMDQINCWTGTGSSRAALVVDFLGDGGNTQAFVWGYRFDGSATGMDMVNAITSDPSTGLTADLLYGDSFVGALYYQSLSMDAAQFAGDTTDAYFYGNTTLSTPVTWTYSTSFGPSGRDLEDMSWDGFVNGLTDASYNYVGNDPSNNPIPVEAVPEPASIALILAGAVALLKLRRK